MSSSPLEPCPDCGHRCSPQAEACPSCGRFFRAFARKVKPGDGWSIAIFWGIMLAWIIPTLLMIGLIVVLFIMGIGVASLTQPRPSSDVTNPRR